MSLTQCGPRCDVCGGFIIFDRSMNPFSVKGYDGELHAHDNCVEPTKAAFAAKDWKMLPDGPLKDAFREQEAAP